MPAWASPPRLAATHLTARNVRRAAGSEEEPHTLAVFTLQHRAVFQKTSLGILGF
jgi:hypothetical protein